MKIHPEKLNLLAVYIHLFLNVTIFLTISPPAGMSQSTSKTELQVGAYLASWNHDTISNKDNGNLPTEQIDWDTFTHLFYFALNAKADGSLTPIDAIQNISPARVRSIVSAAHRHNTPVLFTVGGWGNYKGFSKAISPESRSDFVNNLVDVLNTWGFDGIDLDMEPIKDTDRKNYKAFVKELYDTLQITKNYRNNTSLLTAAVNGQPDLFADLQKYFDHINLMTYDFSGAWEGWVSWHNSPIYSGPYTFPGSDTPLPSVDRMLQEFLQAGVDSKKLSIGIDFYGYVWSGGTGTPTGGVTGPNQKWETPPSVTDNVPFHTIMDSYYTPDNYHWDDSLKAAFLSIDRAGSQNDKFVTYDNDRTIQAKTEYARKHKLGGIFIWELSGGFRKNKPTGQDDLLLQIVKESAQQSPYLIEE